MSRYLLLLLPGCPGHLQPLSELWEGVRMQTGDADGHRNCDSRTFPGHGLAPSRCLQPALLGVTAQDLAESLFGGSRGRQCHPGLAPARCSGYRCANTPGTGLETPQPTQTAQKSAGTADRPPEQGPRPCADGYQGWPGSGEQHNPPKAPCGAKAFPCPRSQSLIPTSITITTTESSSGGSGPAPGSQG